MVEDRQRGRIRRFGGWRWLVLGIGGVVLLLVSARLVLELPAVRSALLDAVAQRVESATGLRLEVARWDFSLRRGELQAEGVVLRNQAGEAALEAERIDVEVDLRSLLSDRPTIESLVVERPRVDPAALPSREPAAVEEEPTSTELPVDLARFELRDASVERVELPEEAAGWLAGVAAREVDLVGSLVDGRLSLELEDGELVLDGERIAAARGEGDGRLRLETRGRIEGPLDGPFEIADLALRGEGAELVVPSARLGVDEEAPVQLAFRADLDLGALLAEVERGTLRAQGELDLRRWRGTLELDAAELPGTLLEPWIGRDTLAALDALDSTLSARADLRLAATEDREVAGTAALSWRSPARALARADLTLTGGEVDAEGRLDWRTLSGVAEVEATELPAELARPFLGGETFARLGLAGARADLVADLRAVAGAPEEVSVGARAELRQQGERWLVASAETLDRPSDDGGLALDLELSLLPALDSELAFAGRVVAPSRQRLDEARFDDARARIEVPELSRFVAELAERWPQLIPAAALDRPLPGQLSATAALRGPVRSPDADAHARWSLAPDSAIVVDARASVPPSLEPSALSGELEVDVEALRLALLDPELAGRLTGRASLRGSLEDWRGEARLVGSELVIPGRESSPETTVDRLILEAAATGQRVELERLRIELPDAVASLSGTFVPTLPLSRADLVLELSAPEAGLERAVIDLDLADGELRLVSRQLDTDLGVGEVELVADLAAVAGLEGLPEGLARLLPKTPVGTVSRPIEARDAARPLRLRARLPSLDVERLASAFGLEEVPEVAVEGVEVDLAFDPTAPAAAVGQARIASLEATLRSDGAGDAVAPGDRELHRISLAQPLTVTLGDGELELEPVRLSIDGEDFEAAGRVDLATDWQPSGELSELVRSLSARIEGEVPASTLEPFLVGARASGSFRVEGRVSGDLEALGGELRVDGRGASLFLREPYVSQLEDPELRLVLRDGRAVIEEGSATLNEGAVRLGGSVDPGEGARLRVDFEEVRYRLDYGLSVQLAGELDLSFPFDDGQGLLAGTVRVERGLVRRDLDLEREVLAFLRGGLEEEATELERRLDLDLTVTTAGGVRVRNNVADLRVRWSPLQVRGTLAEPLIEGTVEVEPGGTLHVYGQTVRVDRGALRFPGRPGAEPQTVFEVTTSLEDPTLLSRDRRSLDPFEAGDATTSPATVEERFVAGLAGYFGDRLAAGLGSELGEGVRVSLRPVQLLSESDPDARLQLTRDLNPWLALGFSLNLRSAERRTYLLDARNLPRLPTLSGQLFTNEEGNEGATVQQAFELGGGRIGGDEPRLARLRFDSPAEVSERRLRRDVVLSPGDELYDGALFDVEIEVAEALRKQGFHDPRVAAERRAAKTPGRVDVVVEVEPGPRSEVVFEGDRPSPAERLAIASIYRSDYYRPVALEEMAERTRSALRGRGWLEPEVEIAVEEAAGELDERVVVRAHGGRRVEIEEIDWRGLGEPPLGPTPGETVEAIDLLSSRFESLGPRVALALGLDSAERTVRSTLGSLGYPEATVEAATLSEDGRRLIVDLALGPRLEVASVEIVGVDDRSLAAELPSPSLRPGDPLRADRLAADAFDLEDALRDRGHLDARVDAVVTRHSDEPRVDVVFEAVPGPRYTLEAVEVDGLRASSRRWVGRLVAPREGETLSDVDVDRTRSALFESGIFSSVALDTVRDPASGTAQLRLDLREQPRFSLGYGLRWESDVGLGGVVDLVDRNFVGWGVEVGLRALYRDADDQRLRGWFASPRFLGSRVVLEGFAEVGEEEEADTFIDTFDSALQLTWPLGRHTRGRVYGRYRSETFAFDDPFLGPFEETVRSPILGVQWLYDRNVDPFLGTSRGLFATVDLSGADPAIGSDFEFLRLLGQVGLVSEAFELGGRSFDWAQSYRVGVAEAFDQELVRTERFFVGGAYSVRGYDRESLGPQERLGGLVRPLGGEALLVINQELRFPIVGDVGGVFFLDAGNVWAEKGDFGRDLATSVGVGGRWASPVGLLRLDLAFPLDRRDQDSAVAIYFGFGHVF